MKTKGPFTRWFSLLIVFSVFCGTFCSCSSILPDDHLSKGEIFKLVNKNLDLLSQSVEQLNELNLGHCFVSTTSKYSLDQNSTVNGLYYQSGSTTTALNNDVLEKTLNIRGLIQIGYYPQNGNYAYQTSNQLYIDYSCGGTGLSVSGSYYGFYYAGQDEPDGLDHASQQFASYKKGWRSQHGDDWYYTEKIRDNWYYYEMHY